MVLSRVGRTVLRRLAAPNLIDALALPICAPLLTT
jgi:hypothetical protein